MDFLRINMSMKSICREPIREEYKLVGGRSLIAKLAYEEIPTLCHPLGPNNKLIVTTTPLAGYGVSSVGRLSIGGKSPLTGGIKESNSGGNAGNALARHGLRAIIVDGLANKDELYIIKISGKDGDESTELIPANEFRGKGTFDTTETLLSEYGKSSAVIVIGQGGEYCLSSAGVFVSDSDGFPNRACGRGGMGAVMGAKGIKAIVIQNDAVYNLGYHDKKQFLEQRKLFHNVVINHSSAKSLAKYGTAAAVLPVNTLGGLPTLNFRKGSWEGIEKLSADTIHDTIIERGGEGNVSHSCMNGCVIKCSNKYADKKGKLIVSPLEYENIALLGPNIGIDDLDAIAEFNSKCNDMGIDTIEIGAALGVAADAGILEFGDVSKVFELLQEIKNGSPIGRIIGNGAGITGKVFAHTRVPVVKNQSMAGHDPRNIKGMSATYATSPMGADHTAAVTFRAEMNHRSWEDAIDVSRDIQVPQTFWDSHCCTFLVRSFSEDLDLFFSLINSVYGVNIGQKYMNEVGKETMKYEYIFNKGAMYTDSSIPEFMKYEGIAPDNCVSDIPQSEYERFWEVEYFGKFPDMKKW